jgi:hypothetical protein
MTTMASGQHTGVPGFFKSCCREASRGGSYGYDHPAYQLTGSLPNQAPYDLTDEEWEEKVDELRGFVEKGEDEAVLAWFDLQFPRCMALVPSRRRNQFLSGVYQAFEQDTVNF